MVIAAKKRAGGCRRINAIGKVLTAVGREARGGATAFLSAAGKSIARFVHRTDFCGTLQALNVGKQAGGAKLRGAVLSALCSLLSALCSLLPD